MPNNNTKPPPCVTENTKGRCACPPWVVYMLPSPDSGLSSPRTPPARKRRVLWADAARNAVVATVARMLLTKDLETLAGIGAEISTQELSAKRMWRVTVLVESAEHGRRLETLLPGWKLFDAVPDLEPDEEGAVVEDFIKAKRGKIVTLMYTARYRISADILVRATGGHGELTANFFRGRKHQPRVLLDFQDGWPLDQQGDT